VDQRVEPPSWLPDGAAGSDEKRPTSDDSVSDGPDSDGPDSDNPVTIGSVSRDPASYDAAGYDAAGDDPADDDPVSHDPVSHDPVSRDPVSRDPVSYGTSSHDPVSHDPVSYGTASHDPVSYDPPSYGSAGGGFGTQGPAIPSSAGDPPGQGVTADVNANAYTYTRETLNSNGQDAPFGQESAPVGAYGQESAPVGAYGQDSGLAGSGLAGSGLAGGGLAGGVGGGLAGSGVGSAPPYPAQLTEPAMTAGKTGAARRRPAFSAAPRKAKAGATPARRADLVLARLEPWSVMKFSFLISLVAWVMLFVAVALLWFALDTLGVFASVQRTLESVTSSSGSAGVSLQKWFSASRILGYTMLIGAVNIVLITALSTVGAMIYNLVTHLGGGIEVTLRESD
jgi:hypothetical protein